MKSEAKLIDATKLTAGQAGGLFGLTGGAIAKWHSRHHAPRNRDRTYNLAKLIAWREVQLRAESDEVLAREDAPRSPALERMRVARAELSELDLAERLGNMVPVADVERREIDIAVAFRTSLESLPAELSPRLADRSALEIEEELEDACRRILKTLSGEQVE